MNNENPGKADLEAMARAEAMEWSLAHLWAHFLNNTDNPEETMAEVARRSVALVQEPAAQETDARAREFMHRMVLHSEAHWDRVAVILRTMRG